MRICVGKAVVGGFAVGVRVDWVAEGLEGGKNGGRRESGM